MSNEVLVFFGKHVFIVKKKKKAVLKVTQKTPDSVMYFNRAYLLGRG